MRVGYDEGALLCQTRGGVSRYVVNLVSQFVLQSSLDVDPVPGWRWSRNAHAVEMGLADTLPGLGGLIGPRHENRAYFCANVRRRMQASKCDLIHHTFYYKALLTRAVTGLRVTTIYDMIPELHPEWFPKGNPHLSKQEYIRQSDLLICISESTKRDLFAVNGDPGVPVYVTPLGVDPSFRPSTVPFSGLPARYLLFVGGRSCYKDFGVVLEAFSLIRDDSIVLIVVGGGYFTDTESEKIRRLGLAGRVRRIDVPDKYLPSIFSCALAFVFPSRYEGFGLPTLEAMACGTPVVLAESSSHPEVGGASAIYFPAGDSEALGLVLAELLADEELRRKLGLEGIARSAKFTWRATAQLTKAAYSQVWRGPVS